MTEPTEKEEIFSYRLDNMIYELRLLLDEKTNLELTKIFLYPNDYQKLSDEAKAYRFVPTYDEYYVEKYMGIPIEIDVKAKENKPRFVIEFIE